MTNRIASLTLARDRMMERGINPLPSRKGGCFRVDNTMAGLEAVESKFRRFAPGLDFWTLKEHFEGMKGQPEIGEFRARFPNTKFRFELAGRVDKGRLVETAVYLLGDSELPLAAMRWLGEGVGTGGRSTGAFLHDFVGNGESVDCMLGRIEEAARRIPAKPRPREPVCVSKSPNGQVYRVRRDGMEFEAMLGLLGSASGLNYSARFRLLKDMPEALEFASKFTNTALRYELVMALKNGVLREAAICVYDNPASAPVAAMRYVAGQNDGQQTMFFQNLLDEESQSVDAVLGSVRGAQPAPADGRTGGPKLFWMGLPQQPK